MVTPAFRAAAFLGDAVASVRAQTLQPLEMIVVDDCSPDDTIAVARSLGVTVVESPRNGGAACARNLGIAQARGDVVAFLDADDRWHPEHLELSLRAMQDTGAILCSSLTTTLDEFPPLDTPAKIQLFSGQELLAHVLGPNPVAQTTCLVRRDLLQRVGAYRDGERHAEDYELWLRLATEGSFVLLEAVTCKYRLHEGQTSRASVRMFAKAWEHRLAAYRRWLAHQTADASTLERSLQTALETALAIDLNAVWYDTDAPARDYFFDLAAHTPELQPFWDRQLRTREAWPVARLRRVARRLLHNR